MLSQYLALGAFASVALAAVAPVQDAWAVALLKRQAPGTPAYACHEDCGNSITLSRGPDPCTNADFLSQYADCLACSGPDDFNIWRYYGATLTVAGTKCGLSTAPGAASPEPEPAVTTSTSVEVVPSTTSTTPEPAVSTSSAAPVEEASTSTTAEPAVSTSSAAPVEEASTSTTAAAPAEPTTTAVEPESTSVLSPASTTSVAITSAPTSVPGVALPTGGNGTSSTTVPFTGAAAGRGEAFGTLGFLALAAAFVV